METTPGDVGSPEMF